MFVNVIYGIEKKGFGQKNDSSTTTPPQNLQPFGVINQYHFSNKVSSDTTTATAINI